VYLQYQCLFLRPGVVDSQWLCRGYVTSTEVTAGLVFHAS